MIPGTFFSAFLPLNPLTLTSSFPYATLSSRQSLRALPVPTPLGQARSCGVVHLYLPWSRVSDFVCLACGLCCYHFRVPLKPHEALSIARTFGPEFVTSIAGRQYISKDSGEPCPFLVRENGAYLCLLQGLGMKPSACKVWPFMIYRRPEHGRAEEAYYSHRLGSFYVYVDQRCPGIRPGRPTPKLVRTIDEAIEVWMGMRGNQIYTTASLTGRIRASTIGLTTRRALGKA